MFTGLIEATACITRIEESNGGKRFTVSIENESDLEKPFLENVQLGDSIAIDGACMTVIEYEKTESFSFEASPESLEKTILCQAKIGKRVNLERPLTPSSRIGGHFVTGHVDGFARLVSRIPEGNSIIFTFEVETNEHAMLLIPKGSIAILGISLTVNTIQDNQFSVAIIPHTLTHTTLGAYEAGMRVNIETDMLGKYVHRFLPPGMTGVQASPALNLDVPALQPGLEAIVSTRAYESNSTAASKGQQSPQIRTGGWFNFTDENSSAE